MSLWFFVSPLASLGHGWIRWVKMRRVIRALERPAECREERAEGERIERSRMVDSDDGLDGCGQCFAFVLLSLSFRFPCLWGAAGAYWEGIPFLDFKRECAGLADLSRIRG